MQRHRLPSSPVCISSADGERPASLARASVAWQATTKPGVQKPHWLPWNSAMRAASVQSRMSLAECYTIEMRSRPDSTTRSVLGQSKDQMMRSGPMCPT